MPPTDTVPGEPLTAYDFAIAEIRRASSTLARALLARPFKKGLIPEKEFAEARRTYDKMVDVYLRLRLDESQRSAFLQELGVLRSRIKECERIP